ncbi:prepilin peptidase [Streptomyces halobius]|uniref:Prepilin peptidase n=1 Tax=Streptomyces halobius TaxID=2879846 RepID=A0ABY4ML96_9ACTN|nr:A24 family peptidase [Streptomyces halobius]UQA97469.1 prepilin peptidase [Streptomyces halobius]
MALHQLLAPLLGLVAGSALRPVVVALAVPAGHPPSVTCPACSPLPPPAGGLQALRLLPPDGRCPACRTPLGAAWLPEVTTAAAFAAVAVGGAAGWYAAAQYWLALLGSALLLIDSAVQRLPNALTLPAAIGTLTLLTVAAAHHEHGSLVRALAAAAAAGVLFTLLALGGMGMGDTKLAVSLSALLGWHSWQAAFLGLVVSFLLAAAVAAYLLVARCGTRKSTLAFGPFLIIGTLAAALITST